MGRNKTEALKELSESCRLIMKYARRKGTTTAEINAMNNRIGSVWYAKEDLDW